MEQGPLFVLCFKIFFEENFCEARLVWFKASGSSTYLYLLIWVLGFRLQHRCTIS